MSFDSIVLTVYDSAGTVYGVTWQTKKEGKPFLEYTSEDDILFEHSIKTAAKMSPSLKAIKNSAEIRGLRPGEKCRYRVGDEDSGVSEDAVFTAFSQDPDKSDFIVVSDTQRGDRNFTSFDYVRDDILSRFPKSEFWINAGDTVETTRYPEQWNKFFADNAAIVRTKPLLPVTGNHDYCWGYTHDHKQIFFNHVNIGLPPQDTRYGIYYSVDNGPVHIAVLNTGDWEVSGDAHIHGVRGGLLDSQIEWLKKDLIETDKEWKIVVLHNPLYSPGKYGVDFEENFMAIALRGQLDRILSEYRVDLVINGHDHVYSETYPMTADGQPITDTKYENAEIEGIQGTVAVDPKGPIHFQPLESGGNVGHSLIDINPPFRIIYDRNSDNNIAAYVHVTAEHGRLDLTTRILKKNEITKQFAFGITKH